MKMDPKTASAMESSGRRLYQAVPHDPELGPLTALPGKWVSQGRGWNMIALPFAATGAPPFRLLLNQYDEELEFTLVDKAVPNRGLGGPPPSEKDQLVVTLDYQQSIRQVAAEFTDVMRAYADPDRLLEAFRAAAHEAISAGATR